MATRYEEALAKIKAMTPRIEQKLSRLENPQLQSKLKQQATDEVNRDECMEDIMRARFARHGSTSAWAADKPETVKSKSKKGESTAPLEGTGALKEGAIGAVRGTFTMDGQIRWDINRVGVRYAKMANKKRPFLNPPTGDELKPAKAIAGKAIAKGIKEVLAG